jgi:type II secretory pathway pseudopilin PulG
MPGRAFTLLELLIAVGLVVALGALALPALWAGGRIEGARLESASGQLSAVIARCRAEAQRSGRPLALLYDPGEGARPALVVRSVLDAPGDERRGSGGVLAAIEREEFPAGLTVSLVRPESGNGDARGVEPSGGIPAGGGAPQGEEVRLAVFMPDGSAVVAGPAYVYAGRAPERAYEVSIARWGASAEVRAIDLRPAPEDGSPAPPRAAGPAAGASRMAGGTPAPRGAPTPAKASTPSTAGEPKP